MTSLRGQDDEVPVDTSLRTFQSTFGIQAPISTSLVPVDRLAINGAVNGRYFEFPTLTSGQGESLFCESDFTQKTIAKIEACVGVGIYSIRLTFVDGSQTPLFGHRQPNVEASVKIDPSTQMPTHVRALSVQAWGKNYVQALTLLGKEDEVIASVSAAKGKGDTMSFIVEPG